MVLLTRRLTIQFMPPVTTLLANALKLIIACAQETTFTPGKLVPSSQAGNATGSLLYLNLSELKLSPNELGALNVALSDWSFKVFADTSEICLTPLKVCKLASNDVLSFALSNLR